MVAAGVGSAAHLVTSRCDQEHTACGWANNPCLTGNVNSPEFYKFATVLKHRKDIVFASTRPSNREGLKDGLGGLRAVLISFQRNPNYPAISDKLSPG